MTGNELKAWRKAKAFDGQAAAAATFGVALRTYQRWEQLKQKPVDKVVALACQAVDLKAALDKIGRAHV